MKKLIINSFKLSTYGIIVMFLSCKSNGPISEITHENPDAKVVFLHHSTGHIVWYGDLERGKRSYSDDAICMVPRLIKEFNEQSGSKISITEKAFPSGDPYPWKNNPYDYYNIWVKNAGNEPYRGESTLEILTKEYDIIIFKHCFPVSKILEDDGNPQIDSEKRTLANYKLQYNALKEKMNSFPETKFIVWTPAALVESATNEGQAQRTAEFHKWVINEWNVPGDNIEVFDFYQIETEGELYLKAEYAKSNSDSHPNIVVSTKAAKALADKIIETYKAKSE